MLAKKCPKCSAVWYTALPKCAFCGIEGVEVPTTTHTGRLPEKPVPAVQAEPEKPGAGVVVSEVTPVPPIREDVPVTPAPTPVPVPREPAPELETLLPAAPVKPEPPTPRAPALAPLPPELKKPDPSTLPPVPRVPSSKVPVVFALLGFAASALLPVAMFVSMNRVLTILAFLVGAVLLPYAPLAWLIGRRYEERCIDLGYRPARSGRAGRLLGTGVTMLLAVEGAAAALLAALVRIQSGR